MDIRVRVADDLASTALAYKEALSRVDELYNMQLGGRTPGAIARAQENMSWAGIISLLSECGNELPENTRAQFRDSLKTLKKGIYDLYPISVASVDEPGARIELILGKVFLSSGGQESYYSGAAGIINPGYEGLIRGYDSHMPLFAKELNRLSSSQEVAVPEKIPELRCMDVFSLSGGLNTGHKPICVFFSGGARENVSSLTNMTVFINLYHSRFRGITERIAGSYIAGAADTLAAFSGEDRARLLLVWLRGHDVGHFFGEDKLGSVMSEFDMDYMILHELKSDFIALYNMRHIDGVLFNGRTLDECYLVALSEMLRYIRRGGIYRYPDSGSAYLTYLALKERGALVYDSKSEKISVNKVLFEEAVASCTKELLDLFSYGCESRARDYVNRWGELRESDEYGTPKSCPEEIKNIISDNAIYYSVDYSFST